MALKKSQLYSSLWQSCDELRGGMDASQYKDYVLTLLFMKYVSDKYAGSPDALIEVPAGGGFADMVKLKGDKEILRQDQQDHLRACRVANELKGVIDLADFNDESKLGTRQGDAGPALQGWSRSSTGLDFRASRTEGDDLLGDAYEYLMQHFATESGKSKGQFYTPAEVSRIMAKVIGIGPDTRSDHTIFDPTSWLRLSPAQGRGRGAGRHHRLRPGDGQRYLGAGADPNMILHDHPTAELWRGNTLAAPYFKKPGRQPQDFRLRRGQTRPSPPRPGPAVSIRPTTGTGASRTAVPPAKNGDYAFLLHLITSLKSRGKGAIILPHGVLFRGNREADIRRNLIRRGFIKGIIGLPGESLLRHRHPRLHPGHRQGERRRPPGHLHDRREPGLPQGRKQEPPAGPGHPSDRRRVQPADRAAALLPHGAGGGDRRPRQRVQPEHCALRRVPASPGTCTTWTPTCGAASPTATSTRSTATGRCSPRYARRYSKVTGGPATAPRASPRRR